VISKIWRYFPQKTSKISWIYTLEKNSKFFCRKLTNLSLKIHCAPLEIHCESFFQEDIILKCC
jgi:hypothetical protein